MTDAMSRLNDALRDRYSIERELGEGGMATVYLAEDLKHQRKVAIKVLKPELAAIVGGERFLAEIRTTANLQHPHILPLHDSGEAEEFLFYVMPYVEGESLRDKLDREKQLGVQDALALTRKVADALDYAHERGVVHRDIKPENILLSERGEPLVADFGIALAVAQAGGGRITETGLSLGTPHYMSPEQATGDRDVDPRSDVFALGCVLYEMLAAQTPFAASTAQAILVKVLTSDPAPITGIRRTVPPHVEAVLARALEKLPADRFESAAEFASALKDEGFTYQTRPRTAPAPSPPSPLVVVPEEAARPWLQDRRSMTALAAGTALAALAAWGWLESPPPTEPDHATRSLVDIGDISMNLGADEIIVSPDGSRFAVTGMVDGQRALYWRDAGEESFHVVPGTVNAREIAFSPEGDWIVYADQGGALLKVSLSGGAPTPVVPSGGVTAREPHWGYDGYIVFGGPTGLHRVPDTGGEPELLHEEWPLFRHPSLLPGGRAVIGAERQNGGVMLLDLETDSVRELIPGGIDPKYVETGHLLYTDASGGLWAAPFDTRRGVVLGGGVPMFDGLTVIRGAHARYSVSRNGTLVYGAGGGTGGAGGQRRLLVVNLEGNVDEPPLDPRNFFDHQWSPDGRSVVYGSIEAGDQDPDIFTYNVALGTTPRPLTFEGVNFEPVWSPDGTRIAFTSQREGTDGFDLFVKNLNDNSPPESLLTLPGTQFPTHWPSADTLVFENGGPPDLWMLDMSSDSAVATEYLPSEDPLLDMRVSPTGDLAAYSSSEGGTRDVYVRSFPVAGARERVSQGGGIFPFWSPDGNRIYYWRATAGANTLMAASVQRGVVTSTEPILEGPYDPQNSSLHPDGDRFVVTGPVASASVDDGAPSPERFLVVVNWFEELKERMGGN